MNSEQWARVTALFEEACACPPADRERWLAAHCADEAIRVEVVAMLRAHETDPEFLEQPDHVIDAVARAVSSGLVGRRLGTYRLVAEIGRGGMGVVYEAQRDDQEFDRRAAIKILPSWSGSDLADRFRLERRVLAGLDHPGIARLVDSGATDEGVPYFVMEYVDGKPIDEWCREHALNITARVALLERVCDALSYAHQHLVIHRDVKPANLLVTADGQPKLLDFGIAALLTVEGEAAMGRTRTGHHSFTPEYASPEQVRGERVTTASDVYSLGVVSYLLLTGQLPYVLTHQSPLETLRLVCEVDPPLMSGVSDAAAGSNLRGDLDAIVAKTLRKVPRERYGTVAEFAADLRAWRTGLPVTAARQSIGYRARRFVRRHRAAVAAAAALAIVVASGIVATAREARIAESQRRRAEARFNDVRKLANSLIFEIHDSIQYLPGATDARRVILQRALEYLDSLSRESENEPDLLRELATAYGRIGAVQGNPSNPNLGDAKAAFSSIQKSVEMREALARTNPHNHADQVDLAAAYLDYSSYQGRAASVSAGYTYAQRALAILEREAQSAPNDLRIVNLSVRALRILGEQQIGEGLSGSVGSASAGLADVQRAAHLAERAVELSPSDPLVRIQQAGTEMLLGDAFLKLGDRSQTFPHYQRAIDLLEPLVRRGDSLTATFNTAVVNGKIGDAWLIEGKTSQTVPYYEEALRLISRLAAADSHNESIRQEEAIILVELGHARLELGRADDGVRYARQALAKLDAKPTSTALIRSTEVLIRGWLGEALERQGKIREASHEYAVSKEVMAAVRAGGANDRRIQGFFASASVRLAATLVKLGEIDKATEEYEQTRTLLEPLVKQSPGDHEIAYVLAETYTAEGTIAATRAEHARTPAAKLAEWTAASAWFRKSLDVWSTVPHPTRISTSGFEVTVPTDVSSRLAQCDQAIASLGGR